MNTFNEPEFCIIYLHFRFHNTSGQTSCCSFSKAFTFHHARVSVSGINPLIKSEKHIFQPVSLESFERDGVEEPPLIKAFRFARSASGPGEESDTSGWWVDGRESNAGKKRQKKMVRVTSEGMLWLLPWQGRVNYGWPPLGCRDGGSSAAFCCSTLEALMFY